MRTRNWQPRAKEGWQLQENSKIWMLFRRVADLVMPSANSQTVLAPPALQGGGGQRPCSSLKEVQQWSNANEPGSRATEDKNSGASSTRPPWTDYSSWKVYALRTYQYRSDGPLLTKKILSAYARGATRRTDSTQPEAAGKSSG